MKWFTKKSPEKDFGPPHRELTVKPDIRSRVGEVRVETAQDGVAVHKPTPTPMHGLSGSYMYLSHSQVYDLSEALLAYLHALEDAREEGAE